MLPLNTYYLMDCMEGMREYPDGYFDIAVVDPPYGISVNHNMGRRKGDKPSTYKKVDWDSSPPPAEYFLELFRVSKNQVIWGGNYFALPPSPCWLCWDKGFSEDVSFASFELAWTSFTGASKRKCLSSVQNDRIHPTQKPIALYSWVLNMFAQRGDRVIDTHTGSASSLIACHRLGLEFVGFEIDGENHRAGYERLEQERAQVMLDLWGK